LLKRLLESGIENKKEGRMRSFRAWFVDDGEFYNKLIVANSHDEAAEILFSTENEFDEPENTTFWLEVNVLEEGDDDVHTYKFPMHPEEPPCDGSSHDWSNDVVRGSGGGVKISAVCPHCGVERVINTWASDPYDGEQGLESYTYVIPY
jgi:hypothetical protein